MNNKRVAQDRARVYYRGCSRPCLLCGSPSTIMHHEDYDKPLNVLWLCRQCHNEYHTNRLSHRHIERIKNTYRWFYIKEWITYQWYIDNKATYFKRGNAGLGRLLLIPDNTFNTITRETTNTFNDPPETLIY
jgi:ribosomal protein S14